MSVTSAIRKSVVIFEAPGGSDKGADGHRKDTMPIASALKAKGWNAEVIFYSDVTRDSIHDYVLSTAVAYVSRVNPGTIPGGEEKYLKLLRKLCEEGVIGFPHPDAMEFYGAKDALVKLNQTALVAPDTFAYYNAHQFHDKFPASLSLGDRVLKQNRGSCGEGIWRVQVVDDRSFCAGQPLPVDTKIKCTEAFDNHVEYHDLKSFLNFCEKYLVGNNGKLIDMRYLPRIREGEIRILLVGSKVISVVHKKPADGANSFSATLFSGAAYTYYRPEKWQTLVEFFHHSALPAIVSQLGDYDIPLFWTTDLILDTDPTDGTNRYLLSEINCSCVGFSTQLESGIQEAIADEIIQSIHRKQKINSVNSPNSPKSVLDLHV